ncbi:DUF6678 family protein [Paenibacillus sp.]|uniref:DUF6678 family protein n=1 Tax=Paenibacillus sp. TaxID=58172 RepID=UPI0037CC73F1
MISDRNLTSIMNDTMWKELQYSVHHELLFPPHFKRSTLWMKRCIPKILKVI